MKQWFLLFWILLLPILHAEEVEKITLPLAVDMERADLYALKTAWVPKAVLILCPGCNGNGEGLIRQPVWQQFAQKYHLGLIGLSFASDIPLLKKGRGYYYASHGSGQTLLDGIHKIYGQDLPVLLFGFSGGAHFTSRFTAWKPERVMTWCAYSAGWWDLPQSSDFNPPGIIACGDQDPRYGASLSYFKQGRALGKTWLWITVPKTGHSPFPPVENFVRNYFGFILDGEKDPSSSGAWIDIDRGNQVDVSQEPPSITGWLPNPSLTDEWRKICLQ